MDDTACGGTVPARPADAGSGDELLLARSVRALLAPGGAAALERGRRALRSVHFHDPDAPTATTVVPSVFVAARQASRLLLVRRCDSGSWELPGGRVDVGETALAAALRETAEESGVRVRITGLVGLYTDPGHVVRAVDGAVRQQFVVVFRARAVSGTPAGDQRETSSAAWIDPADLPRLPIEPAVRRWITDALRSDTRPALA